MALDFYPLPLDGGVNRALASTNPSASGFYTLLGFRQSRVARGSLEQVPYFELSTTLTQGTYYSGGSLTEPTTSCVRGKLTVRSQNVHITDYCARYGTGAGTQMQCYNQTTTNTSDNVNGGCLLVINNLSSLGITLGNYLDVEMTAAAAFRWRKNGGGWTAGVPSTAGVSIDSGNATLYFLASSGFGGTETWSWQRLDSVVDPVISTANFAKIRGWTVKDRAFFRQPATLSTYGAPLGRIMTCELAGTTPYIRTAGYRPIYGTGVCSFEDHLFVSGYSTTGALTNTTLITVAWSDLNDFDCFTATDVNEADSYVLPINTEDNTTPFFAILEIGVLANEVKLYTNMGVFSSPYLGLPIVFNFVQVSTFPLNVDEFTNDIGGADALVSAVDKHYLMRRDGLWVSDGVGFQYLGNPLSNIALGTTLIGASTYDTRFREVVYNVIADTEKYLLVYQEDYGTFYLRYGGLDSAKQSVSALWTTSGTFCVGLSSRRIAVVDSLSDGTPLPDVTGATFGTPTIITHFLGLKLAARVTEISGVYIATSVDSTAGSDYSKGANVQLKVSWASVPSGKIQDASFSTHNDAVWTTAKPDGFVSYPRTAFRFLCLKITLIGLDGTKPPVSANIYSIEPQLRTATPTR